MLSGVKETEIEKFVVFPKDTWILEHHRNNEGGIH